MVTVDGHSPARLAVEAQNFHILSVILVFFDQVQDFVHKSQTVDGKTDFEWALERDPDWLTSIFQNLSCECQMTILKRILGTADLDNRQIHQHLWNFFPNVPPFDVHFVISGAILNEHRDLSLHLFSILGQHLEPLEVADLAEKAIDKKNFAFLQHVLPQVDMCNFSIFRKIAHSNDLELLQIFLECPSSKLFKRDVRALCSVQVETFMLTAVLGKGFLRRNLALPKATHLSKWTAFINAGFFVERETTMVRDSPQVPLLAFLAVVKIRRHLVSASHQNLDVLHRRLVCVPNAVQEQIWKPFSRNQICHLAKNP